jgi:TonB-linked SusC/RagA family outer membrane protein
MVCALSGVLLAHDGHSQSLSQVVVTLDQRNSRLTDVLTAIEKQTKFEFSYTDEIRSIAPLTIQVQKKPLSDVLKELEQKAGVSFRQFDQTIAVSKKAPPQKEMPARPLRGKVTDQQTGEPLPGVSILIKGTSTGTTTDAQGEFTLTVDDNAILVFSFVGYDAQEIPAGAQAFITVGLAQNSSTLDEVMVIGYGEQSKTRVTGAVSQVRSEALNAYSGSSFAQQLAGRAAGVVINDASGQPGSDPQIVIRGIGSLTAGRYPLVVVDGFPLSEGSSLNSVAPQDIETIDILKDPASAGIYGSRAANGVIMITTKKTKTEKMQVNVDMYTGFQERADRVKFVNAHDAAVFFTEARDWGYVSKDPTRRSIDDDRATRIAKGASLRELRLNYLQPYLDGQPGLTDTDWFDELFHKGRISNYSVSFSGKSAKTSYFVSANYFDQQGLVIENGVKRYSGTIKLDSRLSDKVDFGVAVTPSYNTRQYFENGADWVKDPIGGLQIMYPFFSPYNDDGSLAISTQIKANTPEDGALGENVIALMRKVINKRDAYRTFGNSFLSYEIVKGLKWKTLAGADVVSNYNDYYNPSDLGAYRTAAPKPAVAIEDKEFNVNYLVENTLNYSATLGQHHVDVLAGYTFQKENGSLTTTTGSGIPDDNLPNIGGASAFNVVASRYTWTQVSYLARLQYAFKNTYLFTATIRRDGSSRFGDNRKWGNFPSVTAGWIVSNESFFPKSQLLTFAKVRATWGQAGNNQIGSYSSRSQVKSSNYVFGSTLGPGFAATTVGNPNLSWETKTSVNFGIDLGLLEKFTIGVDYYSSDTRDLLLNVPVPEQSGYSSSIQNIGKVRNQGLELELAGADLNVGAFKFGFSGNLATNRNEVLALAPGQQQILTGTDNNFRTRVGGPVAELYGYHVTGVYKTQEQIDNTPHLSGTLPGDYIVEDMTGDGKIGTDDRKGFGTYNPELTYGFAANVGYKNFDLSFAFAGVEGRMIYDRALASFDEAGEGFSVPSQYYFNNRYHPVDNPNGTLAQPNLGNFSNNRKTTRASNVFYKNADYLRLRNVQLSYRLPAAWISRVKLSAAKLYVTANNLFTITEYRGYNPDSTPVDVAISNTNNVLTNGQANTSYPVARSYTIGINVSF